MQKYIIVVAYDGTEFHGWQIQPSASTVTRALQDSFKHVFRKDISIFGASRTDAGVHALGQVAQFHTDLLLPEEKMRIAWSKVLPSSIVVRMLQKIDESFHPCVNVRQKTYYYHLFVKRPLPFIARYGWLYDYINQVDLNCFYKALKIYEGTHDFASFCKVEQGKETVRTIDSITVRRLPRFGALRVEVKGKSFLRFQIRRMIGYALDVARRKDLSIDYLKEVLDSKNPQQTLIKASSGGLCLRKVVYHDI